MDFGGAAPADPLEAIFAQLVGAEQAGSPPAAMARLAEAHHLIQARSAALGSEAVRRRLRERTLEMLRRMASVRDGMRARARVVWGVVGTVAAELLGRSYRDAGKRSLRAAWPELHKYLVEEVVETGGGADAEGADVDAARFTATIALAALAEAEVPASDGKCVAMLLGGSAVQAADDETDDDDDDDDAGMGGEGGEAGGGGALLQRLLLCSLRLGGRAPHRDVSDRSRAWCAVWAAITASGTLMAIAGAASAAEDNEDSESEGGSDDDDTVGGALAMLPAVLPALMARTRWIAASPEAQAAPGEAELVARGADDPGDANLTFAPEDDEDEEAAPFRHGHPFYSPSWRAEFVHRVLLMASELLPFVPSPALAREPRAVSALVADTAAAMQAMAGAEAVAVLSMFTSVCRVLATHHGGVLVKHREALQGMLTVAAGVLSQLPDAAPSTDEERAAWHADREWHKYVLVHSASTPRMVREAAEYAVSLVAGLAGNVGTAALLPIAMPAALSLLSSDSWRSKRGALFLVLGLAEGDGPALLPLARSLVTACVACLKDEHDAQPALQHAALQTLGQLLRHVIAPGYNADEEADAEAEAGKGGCCSGGACGDHDHDHDHDHGHDDGGCKDDSCGHDHGKGKGGKGKKGKKGKDKAPPMRCIQDAAADLIMPLLLHMLGPATADKPRLRQATLRMASAFTDNSTFLRRHAGGAANEDALVAALLRVPTTAKAGPDARIFAVETVGDLADRLRRDFGPHMAGLVELARYLCDGTERPSTDARARLVGCFALQAVGTALRAVGRKVAAVHTPDVMRMLAAAVTGAEAAAAAALAAAGGNGDAPAAAAARRHAGEVGLLCSRTLNYVVAAGGSAALRAAAEALPMLIAAAGAPLRITGARHADSGERDDEEDEDEDEDEEEESDDDSPLRPGENREFRGDRDEDEDDALGGAGKADDTFLGTQKRGVFMLGADGCVWKGKVLEAAAKHRLEAFEALNALLAQAAMASVKGKGKGKGEDAKAETASPAPAAAAGGAGEAPAADAAAGAAAEFDALEALRPLMPSVLASVTRGLKCCDAEVRASAAETAANAGYAVALLAARDRAAAEGSAAAVAAGGAAAPAAAATAPSPIADAAAAQLNALIACVCDSLDAHVLLSQPDEEEARTARVASNRGIAAGSFAQAPPPGSPMAGMAARRLAQLQAAPVFPGKAHHEGAHLTLEAATLLIHGTVGLWGEEAPEDEERAAFDVRASMLLKASAAAAAAAAATGEDKDKGVAAAAAAGGAGAAAADSAAAAALEADADIDIDSEAARIAAAAAVGRAHIAALPSYLPALPLTQATAVRACVALRRQLLALRARSAEVTMAWHMHTGGASGGRGGRGGAGGGRGGGRGGGGEASEEMKAHVGEAVQGLQSMALSMTCLLTAVQRAVGGAASLAAAEEAELLDALADTLPPPPGAASAGKGGAGGASVCLVAAHACLNSLCDSLLPAARPAWNGFLARCIPRVLPLLRATSGAGAWFFMQSGSFLFGEAARARLPADVLPPALAAEALTFLLQRMRGGKAADKAPAGGAGGKGKAAAARARAAAAAAAAPGDNRYAAAEATAGKLAGELAPQLAVLNLTSTRMAAWVDDNTVAAVVKLCTSPVLRHAAPDAGAVAAAAGAAGLDLDAALVEGLARLPLTKDRAEGKLVQSCMVAALAAAEKAAAGDAAAAAYAAPWLGAGSRNAPALLSALASTLALDDAVVAGEDEGDDDDEEDEEEDESEEDSDMDDDDADMSDSDGGDEGDAGDEAKAKGKGAAEAGAAAGKGAEDADAADEEDESRALTVVAARAAEALLGRLSALAGEAGAAAEGGAAASRAFARAAAAAAAALPAKEKSQLATHGLGL